MSNFILSIINSLLREATSSSNLNNQAKPREYSTFPSVPIETNSFPLLATVAEFKSTPAILTARDRTRLVTRYTGTVTSAFKADDN